VILPWREVGGISTSLTRAEADELQTLAADARVLEVGSAYGYSACAMGQVARQVVAIDPHRDLQSLAVMHENIAARHLQDTVTMIVAPSQQVLPILYRAGLRFDLVFIDGDHSEAAVRHDLSWALSLSVGAVACHDYGEDTCPGVAAALDGLFPAGPPRLTDTLWERNL
jgi:predicted O-methyltransferase YrrM